MSKSILTVIKKLYDEWSIHGFVLFSLSLQTILIFFAPFRKRTRNAKVILPIWLAYLVADWAANFAVGLISNSQKDSQKIPDDHADILAFWAPFLLLHLGGPDTITAFAMEDNALWLRHLVGLISQVVAAFIVFSQSFPRNKLWVPTVLLFLIGTIKYGERTRALYLANLNRFRESMLNAADPGPNYAKIMEEYCSKKEAKLPAQIQLISEPNKESKAARYAVEDQENLDVIQEVEHAYIFFQIFKGLIVDLIFSFHDRDKSRRYFNQKTPEEAFNVLSIELNFIYEVLHTKVLVVHSLFGYVVRFISWCAVAATFSTFYSLDKHGFRKVEVGITYTLFFGAIGLDTIALFMLAFSDWTAASIQKWSGNIIVKGIKICFLPFLKYFLILKRINWGEDTKSKSRLERARHILFRRWSESLDTYNLIDYFLEEYSKQKLSPFSFPRILSYVGEKMGLKNYYQIKYVSNEPLTKELWKFIFEELKKKSDLVDDLDTAKNLCSARGDRVLQNIDWNIESSKLMHYIIDVDYDESLILWHIATELCYPDEKLEDSKFCKILSDYMLYLLVMQPSMISAVAGISFIRFRDTCAEAKLLFETKVFERFFETKAFGLRLHEKACTMILEVNTDVEPIALKGDKSKSVLFDACILAKELLKLETQKRWKLMSQVWVELLSYAACHCRANTHAAQLSKGGELITFVWLLMTHFGIGDRFQIKEDRVKAKLIVGK